jgi:UDP-glucose 6-dehydrogenase
LRYVGDRAVVEELLDVQLYRGILAIKSTVTPGTTEKTKRKFGTDKICHVPEFLRERAAIIDFTDNHDVCVIGTQSDDVFEKLWTRTVTTETVHKAFADRSRDIEIFQNIYNAMLITFANTRFYELCQAKGAIIQRSKNAMVQRDHIYNKYLDCNDKPPRFRRDVSPKDTAAISALMKDLGLPSELFPGDRRR